MKIAIESKTKLMFPPASIGYVEMEIDLIQNKPAENKYELRIIDRCFDYESQEVPTYDEANNPILDEDGNAVTETIQAKKTLGENTRKKSYSYEMLAGLASHLQIDFSEGLMTDNINNLFRQGLLLETQMECQQGLTGEGKGMYFSTADTWQIQKPKK